MPFCRSAGRNLSTLAAVAVLMAFAMPCALLAGDVPKPGVLKVYGDWIIGCDNIKSCHATSLYPEDPGGDGASDASGGPLVSAKRDGFGKARRRQAIPGYCRHFFDQRP
jgi:hypothetical protein